MNRLFWQIVSCVLATLMIAGCSVETSSDGAEKTEMASQHLQVQAACAEQALPRSAAVASSQENSSLSASKAIDGNTSTRWSSAFSNPQWIYVDLGAVRHISRVVLNWEAAASANYDIDVSNSPSGPWTVVYTTAAGNGGVDTISGLNVNARYVRMYSRARTTTWGNSLWEFQVFGDLDPACSATPSCLSQALPRSSAAALSQADAASGPERAIDGSGTTRWASDFSDENWIYVNLGARRRISRVVLSWHTSASADYDIEVSNSANGPWAIVYNTPIGNGGVDDITGLGVSAQYVRMYSRADTSNQGVSLYELQVYGDTNPDCNVGVDTDSDRLPDAAETNTRVYVSPSNTGTSPTNPDTDADGILDGDEVLGTTQGLNLPSLGVSPLKKNLLLEYDWMDDTIGCGLGPHSHRLLAAQATQLADAFAAAPVSNPDGTTGIRLIQDYGQGGLFTGGNRVNDADGILDQTFTGEYAAHKLANFAANRRPYFHYVLMPHFYNGGASGGVAPFNSGDMIVANACGTADQVAPSIMHELGHNLGLHHGGDVDTNYKPNYNSVMNYRYNFWGVDTNCAPGGDGVMTYSRGLLASLDERALSETAGICGGVDWDWNENGIIDAGLISVDINRLGTAPDGVLEVLRDYDDWANLFYDFRRDLPAPATALASSPAASPAPQIAVCDLPFPRR